MWEMEWIGALAVSCGLWWTMVKVAANVSAGF